jgi:hypothetical protein
LIGGAIAWGRADTKSKLKAALAEGGGDVAEALLVGSLDRGKNGVGRGLVAQCRDGRSIAEALPLGSIDHAGDFLARRPVLWPFSSHGAWV